jgi:hypothetical protein
VIEEEEIKGRRKEKYEMKIGRSSRNIWRMRKGRREGEEEREGEN